MVLSLTFFAASLTGCGSPREAPPPTVVTKVEVVRETVPAAFLQCRPRPQPPAQGTQRDVAVYILDLDAAGESCRKALAAVKRWSDAPP